MVHDLAARAHHRLRCIGTRHVTGLVGAHNLPGLSGATADGGTWQISTE